MAVLMDGRAEAWRKVGLQSHPRTVDDSWDELGAATRSALLATVERDMPAGTSALWIDVATSTSDDQRADSGASAPAPSDADGDVEAPHRAGGGAKESGGKGGTTRHAVLQACLPRSGSGPLAEAVLPLRVSAASAIECYLATGKLPGWMAPP